MNQPTLFDQPPVVRKKTNYSYGTSDIAYHSNKDGKQTDEEKVFHWCKTLPNPTIGEIADKTGIVDSTVAGRINDLITKGLVRYDETIKDDEGNIIHEGKVIYKGSKRKRIVII